MCNVRTRSIFCGVSCIVVGHTVAQLQKWGVRIQNTLDISTIIVTRTSGLRCAIVRDEPGRTNVALGSSLLSEAEHNQEELYPFHGALQSCNNECH